MHISADTENTQTAHFLHNEVTKNNPEIAIVAIISRMGTQKASCVFPDDMVYDKKNAWLL